MTPTPPGVVGVGTDLVDVARLRRSLERTPTLAARLFLPDELAFAHGHRDPVPHLAARFAAKEAVMKAMGAGLSDVAFTDVEVERAPSGAPSVRLHGRAESRARELGVVRWHLSLSHTDDLAQAVAVASG